MTHLLPVRLTGFSLRTALLTKIASQPKLLCFEHEWAREVGFQVGYRLAIVLGMRIFRLLLRATKCT